MTSPNLDLQTFHLRHIARESKADSVQSFNRKYSLTANMPRFVKKRELAPPCAMAVLADQMWMTQGRHTGMTYEQYENMVFDEAIVTLDLHNTPARNKLERELVAWSRCDRTSAQIGEEDAQHLRKTEERIYQANRRRRSNFVENTL